MPIKVRTKRMVVGAVAIVACLIVAGLAFVFYFMHSVYETEQLVEPMEVPAAVRASFAKQYPDASEVVWESEDGLFEAEFRWQGKNNVEAHYTADGAWAKTVVPIRFGELPGKVHDYLKSQDGYEASEPERIEWPGSPPTFELKLANQLMEWDCLFDAKGDLISRTRDGPVLE